MRKMLRSLAKRAMPPGIRQRLKKYARREEAAKISGRLDAAAFREVVTRDLGVASGDSILVHASYGRIKTDFSPAVAVEILQGIVGPNGNILMPVYPGNGDEWLASSQIFDPLTSSISTGVLAAQFARSPDVQVSVHPIKAVAVWGRDRASLTDGHELSVTPYDAHSPYAKLMSLRKAKVLGFGTSFISFIHCGEDSVPGYVERVYSAHSLAGQCRTRSGEIVTVNTRVHRSEVMRDTPGADFLETRHCTACRKLTIAERSYYVGEVPGIYEHMRDYALQSVQ